MHDSTIKLILVDPNYALATAFGERFAYLPNVEVANCGFDRLASYDCLVSHGNSFENKLFNFFPKSLNAVLFFGENEDV
jgi:hypothetical protein